MYIPYQNTIAIEAELLYSDLGLISYSNYKVSCMRGNIKKLRTGGNGRKALVCFASLPKIFKDAIIEKLGSPNNQTGIDRFVNQIEQMPEAYEFFENYKNENGKGLMTCKVKQYYAEALILEVYSKLVHKLVLKKHDGANIKLSSAKREIADVIQDLKKLTLQNSTESIYPHNLPKNYRALDFKLKKYQSDGLESLIHKAVGNSNSKKIKGACADWILDFYSLPHKPTIPVLYSEYKKVAKSKGFPTLTESAIAKWLSQPKQEKRWYLDRHGKSEFQNKYGHKLSRSKENWFPNAYWAIDGSKVDWMHYKDNTTGIGADIKMDVVFDIYSEKIIGYSFSKTETHQDHFKALKMALNHSGKRPFLFTYDQQSGHKTNEMQKLYDRIVDPGRGKHYGHAARQHGSPVEQLFSRFQQQVLNTKWFSDKQGIKSKRLDSHPNMDFVLDNKHKLHKYEELERIFKACVNEWNHSKHPKFDQTRQEVYVNHDELMESPISLFQIMDLFWVKTKKPVTYSSSGISVMISNEKYQFEVYDEGGNVDMNFRDNYTHHKFFVQYDPDHLDNYVRLFLREPNGTQRYIADAQPKRQHESIPALMTEEQKAQMWKDRQVRNQELAKIAEENHKRKSRTNLTEEQLIEDQELEIKMGGKLPKEQRSQSESNSFLSRLI